MSWSVLVRFGARITDFGGPGGRIGGARISGPLRGTKERLTGWKGWKRRREGGQDN